MPDYYIAKEKTVHLARSLLPGTGPEAGFSALCYDKPKAIDTRRATWTNRPEAVTCRRCKERMEEEK